MMNMDLAAMYGTPGGPSEEEIEKTAQMELFVKLAGESGIDLNQYSDAEIATLWNETFKGAQEGEGEEEGEKKPKKNGNGNGESEEEEEEEKEKESAAYAEFLEAQEWQEKVAEMDYLGRLMAHAFAQESEYIKEAVDWAAAGKAVKEHAGKAWKATRGGASRAGKAAKRGYEAGSRKLEELGRRGVRATLGKERRSVAYTPGGEHGRERFFTQVSGGPGAEKAMSPRMAKAIGAGMIGGGAAGVGAAGYGAHKGLEKAYGGKKKRASAIDEYALDLAVEKVAEANWDVDEAVERLNALYTLDALPESEKIAMASDINEAVEGRALELLEAAGYPVEWYGE